MGRQPRTLEEQEHLNLGDFCVVQLYHLRDCGTVEDPRTPRDFWNGELQMSKDGGFFGARVERGPVFNRHGGTAPDWDTLQRQPIIAMASNDEFHLSTYDVFNGNILGFLRARLKPESVRRYNYETGKQETGKRIEAGVNETANVMADQLIFEGQKTGNSGVMIPKKLIPKNPKLEAYRNGKLDFAQRYGR